jgi:FdhD protein
MENGELTETVDDICVEKTFRLYLNDEFLVEMVATPHQLKELGAGHIICEGLASGSTGVPIISDVYVAGDEIRVFASGIKGSGRSGSDVTISKEDVFGIMSTTTSETWKKTGGTHCSVLFSGKKLVTKSEDVGRHNTVDKVVGYAVLNNIDLSACVLGCTGRQPEAMVSKVANAGIPIVVSRSASTDKGIMAADKAGITLIGFARGDIFTVYTCPRRMC